MRRKNRTLIFYHIKFSEFLFPSIHFNLITLKYIFIKFHVILKYLGEDFFLSISQIVLLIEIIIKIISYKPGLNSYQQKILEIKLLLLIH